MSNQKSQNEIAPEIEIIIDVGLEVILRELQKDNEGKGAKWGTRLKDRIRKIKALLQSKLERIGTQLTQKQKIWMLVLGLIGWALLLIYLFQNPSKDALEILLDN